LYREHIEDYIIPAIGGVRLRDVRPGHIEQVLAFVARPRPGRRSAGPASVRRVHGTVRSAFGTAKRRRLIAFNPAVDVDLPPAPRPKVRPWEPAELGAFLDHAAADPFATLFEVIAATGVRRGEALDGPDHLCPSCGGVHRRLLLGPPKTRSGDARIVDLDSGTPGALIAHRLRQDAERSVWGDTYSDHGLVFAREDGAPMAPERVSKRFAELAKAVGLRPIRLDLRHGQASLMLAAGVADGRCQQTARPLNDCADRRCLETSHRAGAGTRTPNHLITSEPGSSGVQFPGIPQKHWAAA
jgi:integrase